MLIWVQKDIRVEEILLLEVWDRIQKYQGKDSYPVNKCIYVCTTFIPNVAVAAG